MKCAQKAKPDVRDYEYHGESWEYFFDPGEKLLWTGAPSQRIHFKWYYVVLVPTGLMMIGFSVWAPVTAYLRSSEALGEFLGWLLLSPIFSGLGLFVVMVPVIEAANRAKQKYALTNRRAMIAYDGIFGKVLRAWAIGEHQRLWLDDRPLGTVWFASMRMGGRREPIAFEFVEDARLVFSMMETIRSEAART